MKIRFAGIVMAFSLAGSLFAQEAREDKFLRQEVKNRLYDLTIEPEKEAALLFLDIADAVTSGDDQPFPVSESEYVVLRALLTSLAVGASEEDQGRIAESIDLINSLISFLLKPLTQLLVKCLSRELKNCRSLKEPARLNSETSEASFWSAAARGVCVQPIPFSIFFLSPNPASPGGPACGRLTKKGSLWSKAARPTMAFGSTSG